MDVKFIRRSKEDLKSTYNEAYHPDQAQEENLVESISEKIDIKRMSRPYRPSYRKISRGSIDSIVPLSQEISSKVDNARSRIDAGASQGSILSSFSIEKIGLDKKVPSATPLTGLEQDVYERESRRRIQDKRDEKKDAPKHWPKEPPKRILHREQVSPGSDMVYGYWDRPSSRPPLEFGFPKKETAKIEMNMVWTTENLRKASRAWQKHGNKTLTDEDILTHEDTRSRFFYYPKMGHRLCLDLTCPDGRGIRYGADGLIGFLNKQDPEGQPGLPAGARRRRLEREK
jgi:hypothetical protein